MNIKLHELIVPEVKKVGVYAIRNKRTNKYYIGSSTNIEARMKSHRSNLERKRGLNKKMLSDLESGNILDFEFVVLETFEDFEITDIELRKCEEYYIEKYNAYENGYNNPSHSPATNGYFAENELIFCRKPQPKKLNRIDIQAMTNRQLLNFYKRLSSYGHVKTDNFLFAENELLKRLDIRKY